MRLGDRGTVRVSSASMVTLCLAEFKVGRGADSGAIVSSIEPVSRWLSSDDSAASPST